MRPPLHGGCPGNSSAFQHPPSGWMRQAVAAKCSQTLWGIFVKNPHRPQLTVPLRVHVHLLPTQSLSGCPGKTGRSF